MIREIVNDKAKDEEIEMVFLCVCVLLSKEPNVLYLNQSIQFQYKRLIIKFESMNNSNLIVSH